MAYGGQNSFMTLVSEEPCYLDHKESCDLKFYVRRQIDREEHGRNVHVIKDDLQQRNNTFISRHHVMQDCVLIREIKPFVFVFLLAYVYWGLQTYDLEEVQDDLDELMDAAIFYNAVDLYNRILDFLKIRAIKPKSIFWLLDHYFREELRTTGNLTSSIQHLSEMQCSREELQQLASLRYMSKDCLDFILQSGNLHWNSVQRFDMVYVWTKRQLEQRGTQFNPHNIGLFLGNIINNIGIETMGCKTFIDTVYNSNFLTREICVDYLRCILQQSGHTYPVPQPVVATITRFSLGNVRSGKRYGRRHNYEVTPRRRRPRHRPPGQGQGGFQGIHAREIETARRLAHAEDSAAIRGREGYMGLDGGFGNPNHPVQDGDSITPQDDIADTLSFICSHDAKLNEIHVFGNDGGRHGHYRIELIILEEGTTKKYHRNNIPLDTDGRTKVYPIPLQPSVDITKEKVYTIYMVMEGPASYYGVQGNVEVLSNNTSNMVVLFLPNKIGLNGTNNRIGQFPSIVLEKVRVLPPSRS